jgi:hypothetical protein
MKNVYRIIPTLGPTQPPIQWVAGPEADHSSASSTYLLVLFVPTGTQGLNNFTIVEVF